jgi:hypothetical protein
VFGVSASSRAATSVDDYARSRAGRQAREEGWAPRRLLPLSLTETALLLESRAGRHRVRLVFGDGRRVDRVLDGPVVEADRLASWVEEPGLTGPSVVLVWVSDAPDEELQRVQVLAPRSQSLRLEFDRPFLLPKTTPVADRAFGAIEPAVFLEPDGDRRRLVWRKGPRILRVPGREGLVRVAVGAEREVYAPTPASPDRWVRIDEASYRDDLPRRVPQEVEASEQMAKVWGTAQAFWASDGDLKTAWSVRPRARYRDVSLTLRFAEAVPVRLLRVVPGCGASAAAWARHHGLARATVSVGGGFEFDWDLDGATPPPPGIEAMGSFPLADGYGRQDLALLARPRRTQWVRLTWKAHRRPDRPLDPPEACVAEFTVH